MNVLQPSVLHINSAEHGLEMKVLNVGDFVDACDYRGKWCAARVEWLTHGNNGKTHVHFLGYKTVYDETISASVASSRIADLYTQSVDRRNWKIGDEVKLHITGDITVKAPIVDVDQANGTIQVQLRGSEVNRCDLPSYLCDALRWRSILSNDIVPFTEPSLKRSRDELSDKVEIKQEPQAAKLLKPPLLTVPSSSSQRTPSGSWLAPLLRDRCVSKEHILLCEKVLVRDEGFTDASLFRALPKNDLMGYLTTIGITARGLQMKLVDLCMELQADGKRSGAK